MEHTVNCGYGFLLGLLILQLIGVISVKRAVAQLDPDYYQDSCPQVFNVVRPIVEQAVQQEARMAASLVRLHFHDCIVNGCDASNLLDDTPTFRGEKNAGPNKNSLRGFEVIDQIKSILEAQCPETVSCADILAIAARDSVVLTGGPSWIPPLGRTDSLTASQNAADEAIPTPIDSLSTTISKFQAVGLSGQDVVILSGAHTFGQARCSTFSNRLFNFSGSASGIDPTLNPLYATALQQVCGEGSNSNALANLDLSTPDVFDNSYFVNLKNGAGLLQSDQHLYALFQAPGSSALVDLYAFIQDKFFSDFAESMIRMGNSKPLLNGLVRKNCHRINS